MHFDKHLYLFILWDTGFGFPPSPDACSTHQAPEARGLRLHAWKPEGAGGQAASAVSTVEKIEVFEEQ